MAASCNCSRCRSTRAAPTPMLAPAPRPLAAPPPAPSTTLRSHLRAYADHFTLMPCSGGAIIPLQRHHSQGRYGCHGGVVTIPDDGYYMLLWELDINHVKSAMQLQLGINDTGSMLCDELKPGYDSGQQVTWLSRSDKLSLQVLGNEHGELHGKHAQLTIIRLG